jgi:hypothetical protein
VGTTARDALRVTKAKTLCGSKPPPNGLRTGAIEVPPARSSSATNSRQPRPQHSRTLERRPPPEQPAVPPPRIEICKDATFNTLLAVHGDESSASRMQPQRGTVHPSGRQPIEHRSGVRRDPAHPGRRLRHGHRRRHPCDRLPWTSVQRLPGGPRHGDGLVAGADLGILLGAWGGPGPLGDLDGSSTVGGADLAIPLGSWGPCP